MGSGYYRDSDYHASQQQRRANNVDDFAYSKTNTTIHPSLDPKRINKKPFGKLESRDNKDHPESNAVVVTFDVTGSNIHNARVVQKKLPILMGLLARYLKDPQVAIAANDDIEVQGTNSVQISEFESDIRIDESIRNILLTGDGGGNDAESYDLMLYGIARKTVLDCFEKRGRKGYCFIYADEPMRLRIEPQDIHRIYGDRLERFIPLEQIVKDLMEHYQPFVMWPANSPYKHSYEQYKTIFGAERIFVLESAETICEFIGAIIGMNEQKVDDKLAEEDLVHAGTDRNTARQLIHGIQQHVRLLAAGR